ncbi:MAG: hypothetical protein WC667_13210 [Sulfurimonas sp.]|jgi:hypothetical protein
MSILKKSFQINFTQVPNFIINDKKVSLKAKGLYLYMVSKPDNWEFSLNGMEFQLHESKGAILRIMDELIEFGYLEKIKNRVGSFQGKNDYILHLEPQNTPEFHNETLSMRLPLCDSQNGTTSNTIQSNKDIVIPTTREDFSFNQFREIFISKYKHGFHLADCKPWKKETLFKIDDNGLIVNLTNNKLLSKDEAYVIWNYLFKNELKRLKDEK